MKIAVVIPSFYPATIYGGTIFASLHLAELMTDLGHDVFVSTTNTNKHSKLNIETGKFIELKKNIFVRYYNETIIDKLSLPLLFNLRSDIQSADLVHIHAIFNTPVPAALLTSYLMKKPVLLSPHGVLGDWVMKHGSVLKKLWLTLFIKPFARYVHWHATSIQEENEIKKHFPNARVHILPNPLNTSAYKIFEQLDKTAYLKKFGNATGNPEKILVSMGRLQKKKGFDILIQAFKKLLEKNPGAYLFIAGEDDGEKVVLLNLIHQLQLEEKIFLTGNLEEDKKFAFLGNADLFVLPSHNENFGIVYAEALAAGVPVIASKETPWKELETYECGKWSGNSVEEVYNAMLEMIQKNDPEIKKKAYAFADKFSFNNVRNELKELITRISQKDVA